MQKLPSLETAAVRLREAAIEFADHRWDIPRDVRDTDGLRRNRRLLQAALTYAKVRKPC